jgi:hypothetical protein
MPRKTMTEAEWLACTDSYPMLRPCRRIIRYNPRKGWLFAAACCDRIGHLLADERSRVAVRTAAQFADGLVSEDQLRKAATAASAAHEDAFRARGKVGACAEWAAQYAASSDAWHAASRASNFAYVAAGDGLQPGPEHAAQSDLLCCIFGNPFRPATVNPSWLTWNGGTVPKLAQAIYDERRFADLPILADALEEAGCTNADILDHCRRPGEHLRGCWVVDLLLGKE